MSGVYIKGMEMPKACVFCELYESDAFWCSASREEIDCDNYESVASFCPLVPVPPHGRLIDADALERELRENAEALKELFPHTGTRTTWFEAYEHFADIIAVEPTIIEAEGESKK